MYHTSNGCSINLTAAISANRFPMGLRSSVACALLFGSSKQYCFCLFYTGRNYEDEEDARRKHIFSTHLKRIEMHNYLHSKGLKSFRLGITPFADMVRDSSVKTMCYVAVTECVVCGAVYIVLAAS